jgi:hypothetical protein
LKLELEIQAAYYLSWQRLASCTKLELLRAFFNWRELSCCTHTCTHHTPTHITHAHTSHTHTHHTRTHLTHAHTPHTHTHQTRTPHTRTHLTNTRAHTRTHTHKHTHVSLHSTRRSASWHLVSVHKVCPGLVVPADHLPGVWGVDVLDWVCKMGACVVLVHITVYDYLVHIIVLVSDSVLPLCLVLLCVLFHCRTLNTSVPLTQCGSRS